MTDERGLDRAQEEQVRRLLSAARHDEPVPDDVVARLDAALAAERPAGPDPTPGREPVDELSARRRRWTAGLAAAALVVAVGVGADATGLLDGGSGGSSESGSDADGSAPAAGDADEAGPDAAEDRGPGDLSGQDGLGGLEEFSTEGQARSSGLRPRVRAGAPFVADVRAALDLADGGGLPPPPAATRCAPADATGRVVGVRFEGRRADLVVSPADGVLDVALWVCGRAAEAERTLELPAG